ncbi:MAG: spermidine synthase, partial [Merismopedia sp. SIO2A8]|nr:spermidine synthase [Merismopedia sp. SIO2A8]
KTNDETFDLIVIDSSDPVGPSEGLFTQSFYQDVYRCLRLGAVLTAQGESPHFNKAAFVDLNLCLRRVFHPDPVFCYLAFIPTYPTGMWSFNYCAKRGRHPIEALDRERSRHVAQSFNLEYYNSDIHSAAFCLPTFIQKMLSTA